MKDRKITEIPHDGIFTYYEIQLYFSHWFACYLIFKELIFYRLFYNFFPSKVSVCARDPVGVGSRCLVLRSEMHENRGNRQL